MIRNHCHLSYNPQFTLVCIYNGHDTLHQSEPDFDKLSSFAYRDAMTFKYNELHII